MSSAIFKETSELMITPLMSILNKHQLAYGELLIRQGEDVKRLYFLAEGQLKVIYLDRVRRTIKHLNLEEKVENFHLGKSRSKSKSKNYSIHKTFYYP